MSETDYEKAKTIAEHLHAVAQGHTGEECEEYNQWVIDNPSAYELMQKLQDPQKLNALLHQIPLQNKELSCKQLERKMKRRTARHYIRKISTAAAIVIFVIGCWYLFRNEPDSYRERNSESSTPQIVLANGEIVLLDNMKGFENNELKIETTKNGEIIHHVKSVPIMQDSSTINKLVVPAHMKYTIQLPDSSRVTVNANSTLSYPTAFNGNERRVEIQGEAFFEVGKNEKPFIVVGSGVEIKAYGTSFNVNNYLQDKVETILISGSVGVILQGKDEIRLLPNQKALADLNAQTISQETVKPEKYIAWTQGYFFFEGDNLDVVLQKLSLWYGVKFEASPLLDSHYPIVARYRQDTPLEEILKTIELTTHVAFIKQNGKYQIQLKI